MAANGKFKKGCVPWNKGLIGVNGYSKNETSFLTGNKHPKYRPIGSERIEKKKVVIKVSNRKWMPKHRYLWEQINGEIPKNHVVIFANGDNRDFKIENLILVSRAQLAVINKFDLKFDNEELTKTGIILSDLIMAVNRKDE